MPFVVRAEQITDYGVEITVQPNASIAVQETIHYDFADARRHGIFREIPVSYTNSVGDKRTMAVTVHAVTDQTGAAQPFTTQKSDGMMRIKIGDANVTVSGPKTYVITYDVEGMMNYFETHDELYWNAIGTHWTVPIVHSTVTVHAPMITKTQCYAGARGATSSCTQASGDEHTATFTQTYLPQEQGVTVVIGMPVGTVTRPTPQSRLWQYIRDNWPYGAPLVVTPVLGWLWYRRGRDPQGRGTVVPEYDAPEDMTPMDMVMIMRNNVPPKSIAAEIINLAVHGYLTIAKAAEKKVLSTKDDYAFTRTDKNDDTLPVYQQKILDGLFPATKHSVMSDLKETFHTTVQEVQKDVQRRAVDKGYYHTNPVNVFGTYFTVAVVVGVISIIIASNQSSLAYAVGGVVSAIIIGTFAAIMPRRTKSGAVMREQVAGLKMYITTAEKDRIAFHNAPEKTPERFEKLLPYAMALGVEDAWAAQFEDMFMAPPQWYDGGGAPVTPAVLASDLHTFGSQANTIMMTTASRGGSGFGGGGTGGGGGGGGGGSW